MHFVPALVLACLHPLLKFLFWILSWLLVRDVMTLAMVLVFSLLMGVDFDLIVCCIAVYKVKFMKVLSSWIDDVMFWRKNTNWFVDFTWAEETEVFLFSSLEQQNNQRKRFYNLKKITQKCSWLMCKSWMDVKWIVAQYIITTCI